MSYYNSTHTGQEIDAAVERSINTATDLAKETTARTEADATLAVSVAAALNTALGVGTQTAFETIAKCVTLASASDISTFCNDLIVDRRAAQTNGVYILRLRTGQNVILFQTGNSNSDTPTTSHYREQVVIGNVARSSQTADPDKGFAFGVLFSGSALNVISRAIHYTGSGTDYEVTQEWTTKLELIS